MKTAVVVCREFNGQSIRQNSKSGFLNLNDLYEAYLATSPKYKKYIGKYLSMKQTEEFAETIRESLLEANNQNIPDSGYFVLPLTERPNVIETKRGKNGGTWVHPYLFLDFAMWLNPRFKLWAMSIIEDKLIELRNEAGDNYKEMQQALKISGAVSPRDYVRECNMINKLVFGTALKEQRNSATQEQLDLLSKLQKYNAHLIDKGMTFTLREKECSNFISFYNFIK